MTEYLNSSQASPKLSYYKPALETGIFATKIVSEHRLQADSITSCVAGAKKKARPSTYMASIHNAPTLDWNKKLTCLGVRSRPNKYNKNR